MVEARYEMVMPAEPERKNVMMNECVECCAPLDSNSCCSLCFRDIRRICRERAEYAECRLKDLRAEVEVLRAHYAGSLENMEATLNQLDGEREKVKQLTTERDEAIAAFQDASRLRSEIQQERIKAQNERDESRAKAERLKDCHSEVPCGACATCWAKAHSESSVEVDRLRVEIKEESDFRFELSQKAPHLMGCAKTVSGKWICDERCLVSKVEQLTVERDNARNIADMLLETCQTAQNRADKNKAEVEQLKTERPTDAQQRALNAATYTTAMDHLRMRQERDALRTEVERVRVLLDENVLETTRLIRENREARAEVERQRGLIADAAEAEPAALRSLAERQREACAKQFEDKDATYTDRGNASWVRATPLVTAGGR